MTYSTSSCLVTKLWIHGMYIYIYIYIYMYVCMESPVREGDSWCEQMDLKYRQRIFPPRTADR
jgi:hypothetical protein